MLMPKPCSGDFKEMKAWTFYVHAYLIHGNFDPYKVNIDILRNYMYGSCKSNNWLTSRNGDF